MEWDEILAATSSHAVEFLGLEVDEAHALAVRLGLHLRVRTPDMDCMTLDLLPIRITVWVDDAGRVNDASAG